ncbi:hypothetical protein [Eubacterium sp.]
MKFVGKKYVGDDVYSHWGEWFANGWFDKVEAAMGGVDNILNIWKDGGGYVGLEFRKEGELLEYWIGMFATTDTVVPEGFECVQFEAGNIGVCWNYGGEDEVHDVGNNWKYILKDGMEFKLDERGYVAQFENGLCPRFTTPDENGNVILDYCFYVK